MRRKDAIISAAVILVLGGTMLWAVLDTRRRSRDTVRVSDVRVVQAALEMFRAAQGSYPEDLTALREGGVASTPMDYATMPEGCGPASETLCAGYEIRFILEGRVGTLPGGACVAHKGQVTCVP